MRKDNGLRNPSNKRLSSSKQFSSLPQPLGPCISPDQALPVPQVASLQDNYGTRAQAESCSDQPAGSAISSMPPLITWPAIPLLYTLLSVLSLYTSYYLSASTLKTYHSAFPHVLTHVHQLGQKMEKTVPTSTTVFLLHLCQKCHQAVHQHAATPPPSQLRTASS